MVTYVIVLFFLAIWRKSELSPAQREKHLAAWGKTGLVTSVASQKERNSSLKKKARSTENVPGMESTDALAPLHRCPLHSPRGRFGHFHRLR